MSSVMAMIPGFGNDMMPKGQEKESQAKVKRMMCLMDSMTDEELDATDLKMLQDPKRMERIGRGAGRGPGDVVELIEEYKRLAKMMGKMKGLKVPKKEYGQTQALNQNLNQMASAIRPRCSSNGRRRRVAGHAQVAGGEGHGRDAEDDGEDDGGEGHAPGDGGAHVKRGFGFRVS